MIRRYICFLLLFLVLASAGLAESSGEIRNRIEQEYGIRILLPDECEAEVRLPDGKEYGSYMPLDLSPIARYTVSDPAAGPLRILEETLACYPEGFCSVFTAQGGILKILMAGSIRSTDHPDDICSGIAFVSGGDYILCLSLSDFRADVIHHEMWHAIERRIRAAYPEAFAEDEWMK